MSGTTAFRHFAKPCFRSGLVALALLGSSVVSSTAMAAIVCNAGTVPITVPNTTAGVYLNLVTGAAGLAAAAPGWDVNLWGSPTAPAGLRFFSSAAAGSQYVGASAIINLLPPNTLVSAASTFTTSGQSPAFQAGVTGGYFGIRFLDQASAVRYGWVQMTTIGPTGFPATITGYCYQDDGTGITTGTTPVSLQNFSVD